MSRKNKMNMPQSTAGLVRYFDEYKEAIQIKPEYILGITVGIIIFSIILRFLAR